MATQLEHDEQAPVSGFGLLLFRASAGLALLGGFILLAVVLMTTVSVAGRYLFRMPVPGDYEIVGIGCGIAIMFFFPYCEMASGNIKASFFTDNLADRWKQMLNMIAELLFLATAGLLTWRFVVGGLRRMADGQSYMYTQMPIWWAYIPATFAMGLLVVVAVYRLFDYAQRFRSQSSA